MKRVHIRIFEDGITVRRHAKAYKWVDVARGQIAAGAHGICWQKSSEAEVFVGSGFDDVLITNQIVGTEKCRRVARLASQARTGICVDHSEQIRQIGDAALAANVCVEVLIEVDIGHGRCGITSASAALTLARALQPYQLNLAFRGIHAFRGPAQPMRDPTERAQAVSNAVTQLKEIVAVLEREGFHCATVTGGGTGTYPLESPSSLYTEVQPGSYVLMDTDYAANRNPDDTPTLSHALFGLCTANSPRKTRLTFP